MFGVAAKGGMSINHANEGYKNNEMQNKAVDEKSKMWIVH